MSIVETTGFYRKFPHSTRKESWKPRDFIALKGGNLKRSLGMASPAFIPSRLRRAGFTIPKAFPGYGVAFAETSGFEATT